MIFIYFLLPIFLNVCTLKASVLLCSSKKIQISPLKNFTKEDLFKLTKKLGNPKLYYFETSTMMYPVIKNAISGCSSAYLPNGEIGTDDLGEVLSIDTINETLSKINEKYNVLSVIFTPNIRYKRETGESTESTEVKQTPKGPVIYKAKNINNDLYALLYSSKPLLLKTNDSDQSEILLGNTSPYMIIYDSRLNVNVISEGGIKITLRFSFSWVNGYWSLPSVRITDTKNKKDYNLTTDEDISAPAHFSYHCNGHSLFSDGNGVELYIYDLQVQIDSKNEKFGDANDCVSFTTAPIWSGLFVTTLLGIGLIVALTAIMDIKTMDKFDNHKMKNLNITVSE